MDDSKRQLDICDIKYVRSEKILETLWAFVNQHLDLSENHPRSLSSYKEVLHATPTLLIYASKMTEIIGIALASINDKQEVHIGEVAVAPAYQKTGVGSAMLTQMESNAKNLGFTRMILGAHPWI